MRIERVVAGTFSEASERSRKLYGPDVLLISSSRVGNVHELLLCTDTTDSDDETASGDAVTDTGFVSALQEQMQQRPVNARVERHREPTSSRPEAKTAESGADGAALVGLIRKEFLALERLLATGGVIPRGADQRMALLEQGVSAAYAGRLIDAGVDASSMATRLLADLSPDAAGERLGARPAVLVGPAAVGKTTVAMQTALLIASSGGEPPVVSAARDPRLGARDRFFAMADAAKIESNWGVVAPGSLVIDAGGDLRDGIPPMPAGLSEHDLYLCIPAYSNRNAASRWFDDIGSVAGVILTHWSSTEVPIGLLAAMAERGLPLAGLSDSDDVTRPLTRAVMSAVHQPVRNAFELALNVPTSGVE